MIDMEYIAQQIENYIKEKDAIIKNSVFVVGRNNVR